MIGRGLRIGKIFGITIIIDWSWLFIFALVTWNLGTIFGDLHRDWNATESWGVAIVASLLFFGSVLAHELAHSVVAKAKGIAVKSITLFLFGGVSNIQKNPPTPGVEFLVAIVGPAMSVVLGVIFTVVGLEIAGFENVRASVSTLSRLGPVATLLLWLGPINVILGIFNMLPGFPLDGGRVLRSIFWAITDNLRRATRWASWVGQGIAWLMILVGIMMVFGAVFPYIGGGFINGLWLIFIGWFLNSASVQSYQQIVIQDVLEGIPVSRMMRACPPTVSPDISIDSVVHDHIMNTDDHAFPVLDHGRLVGLIALEDIRKTPKDQWVQTRVSEVMTPIDRLQLAEPEEDAGEALTQLMQRDVGQLPVLDKQELVGCLRRQDIMKWLQIHHSELQDQ